ncbi:hypothetical protein ACWDTP_05375 [Mycobacterium sp. NPDC003449]
MSLKKIACMSTLAAGIGMAGMLGLGLGTAAAQPGPGCAPGGNHCAGQPNGPGGSGPGNGPAGWHDRGIDQGRQDHQPFNWNGQQVTPMPAGNGPGWGFWFLGTWIPL